MKIQILNSLLILNIEITRLKKTRVSMLNAFKELVSNIYLLGIYAYPAKHPVDSTKKSCIYISTEKNRKPNLLFKTINFKNYRIFCGKILKNKLTTGKFNFFCLYF